jgi:chromosome segregation ATPase
MTLAPIPPPPAPVPPMPLADALAIAEQMENRYRAFARAKEVLHAAVGAESLFDALKARQATIEEDIGKAEHRREEVKAETHQAQVALAHKLAERQSLAESNLQRIQAQIDQATTQHSAALAAQAETMARLTTRYDERAADVLALETKIGALKAEVAALVSRFRIT